MSWYEDSLVYQIYPLGALDAPYENDGTGEVVHRLPRLADWIDHLKRLGVTCVMLNPVWESASHGYDTRDLLTVDRRLGTNDDLRELVAAYHEAGIKVILDTVLNHVGRDFWAFADVRENGQASAFAAWFNIHWGGYNEYNDGFSYDTWANVPYLVKLNHHSFECNAYCADVIRTWEREYDIDGLRLDVAYCLDRSFLGYLRQVCDELTAKRGSKFLMLGETMFGDYNLWMNDNACDTVTNYEAYKGFWSSFNSANMHEIGYALERQSGSHPWDLYTGKHLLNFLDNHDVPRIGTRLEDPDQLPVAWGLLFGMCGVPCIYYGSEWGIEGEQHFGDHELRPPVEAPEWNGLTDWIAALARVRAASPALLHGSYTQLQVQPEQLVFERKVPGQRVIVAVNAAHEPAVMHFNANCGRAVDLITGEPHDFGGGSKLPPLTVRFWECER